MCTSILWTFSESAHIFRGSVSRVRRFFSLLLKCAQVSPPCCPKFPGPGSGFRVLAGGSSCWRAVTLIPQTFSLTAGEPAQPCAPNRPRTPAVPGKSRPGPAAPSRGGRGPARRRRPGAVEARPGGAVTRLRPGVVEARPGGAVPGRSRPSPAALSRCNWSVGRRRPVRHRRHLPGSALTCDRESGGSGSRAREGGDRACARAHHQLLGLKGNGEHAHAWLDLRQGGWRGRGGEVDHACALPLHQLRGRGWG